MPVDVCLNPMHLYIYKLDCWNHTKALIAVMNE